MQTTRPAIQPTRTEYYNAVAGLSSRAKATETLFDRFFNSRDEHSFRRCYVEVTGDKRITGRWENVDRSRMAESIGSMREALDSTSFATALGAAVSRSMVREFRADKRYAAWRKFVKISTNIPDFRSQLRVRFGGYGDLPIVGEGSSYLSLPSPADESASFAVQKRGGVEAITLEMIKNDDVGAIRRLPKKLADAAHRTLAHFVLDFLRLNPVIYDGVPLFHGTHQNLGNAALSESGLAAARAAMMGQTEMGSGDRLNIEPKYLMVPIDLEETAFNLFRRGTNKDKTFVQDLKVEVVPVWYWTDANDWVVSADSADAPTIEVGFLNGNEEPELFFQDAPSVGSMFSHDRTTFKIRHIYGGAAIDYRGIYKSVIA